MSNGPHRYLIDTNILIQASNQCYPRETFPGFWTWMIEQCRAGRISSIDKVRDEILRKDDELAEWARADFRWWEKTTTESTKSKYEQLVRWAAKHEQYDGGAKEEFVRAEKADAWLIAHAWAIGGVVVTEEEVSEHVIHRIPIPNVCQEMNIPWMDTLGMLRRLGARIGA